jgi:hypothetical protein
MAAITKRNSRRWFTHIFWFASHKLDDGSSYLCRGLVLTVVNLLSESRYRLILQMSKPPGFNAETILGKRTAIRAINQFHEVVAAEF